MNYNQVAVVSGAGLHVKINTDTAVGHFEDTIYYTPAAWQAMTSGDQIDVARQARIDNYVAFIEYQIANPPPPPTLEELQARRVELVAQLAALDLQIEQAQIEE